MLLIFVFIIPYYVFLLPSLAARWYNFWQITAGLSGLVISVCVISYFGSYKNEKKNLMFEISDILRFSLKTKTIVYIGVVTGFYIVFRDPIEITKYSVYSSAPISIITFFLYFINYIYFIIHI